MNQPKSDLMFRRMLWIFFLLPLSCFVHGQGIDRPPLGYTALASWPTLDPYETKISNDGKYVLFTIGSHAEGTRLIVTSVDSGWKEEIPGVAHAIFTDNSRWVIFQKKGDSLGIIETGTPFVRYVEGVTEFRPSAEDEGKAVAYRLKGADKALVIFDPETGKEQKFLHVMDHLLSSNGKVMVIKIEPAEKGQPETLAWADLESGNITTISKGYIKGIAFNEQASAVAFTQRSDTGAPGEMQLKYFKPGMSGAELLVDKHTPGMDGMNVFSWNISFSRNGEKVFFNMDSPSMLHPQPEPYVSNKVHIYSYLNERPVERRKGPFAAVFNINKRDRVSRLSYGSDGSTAMYSIDDDKTWLVTENDHHDVCIITTGDGSRKLIKKGPMTYDVRFSAGGKYLSWYDRKAQQWFTYSIATGITTNISNKIPYPLGRLTDEPDYAYPLDGPAGWMEHDEALLIYDRYDIWKLDPDGRKDPINLTLGYGRRNNIELRYWSHHGASFLQSTDTLILTAFDCATKSTGLFSLPLSDTGGVKKIVLESGVCYCPPHNDQEYPKKALHANTMVSVRMSPTEYPNLYAMDGAKHFHSLTNLAPQRAYNWYTCELYHWKLDDGRINEGVLYKPENFDAYKKYPIIFYYYEQLSDQMNFFNDPALTGNDINIPWFVSNGYLVFTPDIHYTIGHPGQSAYNSVVSAAKYLSKFPWVDSRHMGIQGHSFGGFETNYIVTHTDLFAAANAGASVCNLTDLYTKIGGQDYFEHSQGRMGATLWEKPEWYIENSPIFRADKMNTPLLLMHNEGDPSVPYTQAQEWIGALIRSGKKVWMLSYDGEEHSIWKDDTRHDFTIRLCQFFDHYLKGAPMPRWMSEKVERYVNDGFGLTDIVQ